MGGKGLFNMERSVVSCAAVVVVAWFFIICNPTSNHSTLETDQGRVTNSLSNNFAAWDSESEIDELAKHITNEIESTNPEGVDVRVLLDGSSATSSGKGELVIIIDP